MSEENLEKEPKSPEGQPKMVKGVEEIVVGAKYYPHSLIYGHEGHRTLYTVLVKPYQDSEGVWKMKVNSKYLGMSSGTTEEVNLAAFGVVPNADGSFSSNWLEKESS